MNGIEQFVPNSLKEAKSAKSRLFLKRDLLKIQNFEPEVFQKEEEIINEAIERLNQYIKKMESPTTQRTITQYFKNQAKKP